MEHQIVLERLVAQDGAFTDLLGMSFLQLGLEGKRYPMVFLGSQLDIQLEHLQASSIIVGAAEEARLLAFTAEHLPADIDTFLASLPEELDEPPTEDCRFQLCTLACDKYAPHGKFVGQMRRARLIAPISTLQQAFIVLGELSLVQKQLGNYTAAQLFLEAAQAGVPPDATTMGQINRALKLRPNASC